MSTIAHNNAVSSGSCAVVISPEHAVTISAKSWTRNDVKSYLWMHTKNTFADISFNHRYGKVYNRNIPKWYRREADERIPIVPSPENIHLFVAGGEAGRFSAFIPGWGHMMTPVLRAIDGKALEGRPRLRGRHLSALEFKREEEETMSDVITGQVVYDPRGVVEAEAQPTAKRVRNLKGLKLGVLDNTKWNGRRLLEKTTALMEAEGPFSEVRYYKKENFSKMRRLS